MAGLLGNDSVQNDALVRFKRQLDAYGELEREECKMAAMKEVSRRSPFKQVAVKQLAEVLPVAAASPFLGPLARPLAESIRASLVQCPASGLSSLICPPIRAGGGGS